MAPRVLIFEGQSGTGKSTLVQQLLRLQCLILCGTTDSVESSTPYYALGPILDAILGAKSSESPQMWIIDQGIATEDGPRRPSSRSTFLLKRNSTKHGRHSEILQTLVSKFAFEETATPLLNMVVPIDIPETATRCH